MDGWTMRSMSHTLSLIFAHRTPESHVQTSADSSWLGILSNVLFMLGKSIGSAWWNTFPALTVQSQERCSVCSAPYPLPSLHTFLCLGHRYWFSLLIFVPCSKLRVFSLLQVETKSICMTFLKVMGFKLEEAEELIFKLFGFLFLTFCWWTRTPWNCWLSQSSLNAFLVSALVLKRSTLLTFLHHFSLGWVAAKKWLFN